MKRIMIPMLVVPLLSACAGPTVYQRECAMSFATYPEIFTCTKDKLVGDPRGMGNLTTADTTELVAYGEPC